MSETPEREPILDVSGVEAEEPGAPAMAGPLADKAGKSKEEIYLELAKLAQQSFENRRSMEWKVAFGLWTGIGAFTYFAVEHGGAISGWALVGIAVAYLAITGLWSLVWQPSLRAAFDRDKDWKHYYMHRAEQNRLESRRDTDPWVPPSERTLHEKGNEIRAAWRQPWTWSQVGVTVVFLAMSWVLIYVTSQPVLKQDDKDRIVVSGENASKIVDKLVK